MALNPPKNLVATVVSPNRIDLSWDNDDKYHIIQIWENKAGGGYGASPKYEIDGNEEFHELHNLDENTNYKHYLVGEIIEPPEESDDSNETNVTTFEDLEDPTNLVVTIISGTEAELIWEDNAEGEDGYKIERKPSGGSFSEVGTVAKNMEYFKDTGLTPGQPYEWRVRAYQTGPYYSGYSNIDTGTAMSVPAAPTSPAISEKSDKWMRLTWTPTTNETGYKIEKSTNGVDFNEIAKIGAGLSDFLVTNLDPNTQYWFKWRAYNAAGNSSYTSTVNDTTLASYSRSDFEKLIRRRVFKPIYLIEINPQMEVSGFTLTSGKTYTYEKTLEDRAIDIEGVTEDGDPYAKKTSVDDVEANASSFYFDYANRKLYVHTSDGTNPSNFTILTSFWLYFSNVKNQIYNGKKYLPFLSAEDIPDMSDEIKPTFKGTYSISSGTITLKNPKIKGEHYFYKLYARYIWEGRKIVARMGGDGFTYSKFRPIQTGLIDNAECFDLTFTIDFKDLRGLQERQFTMNYYNLTDYPEMDDELEGKPILRAWGKQYGIIPDCIDFPRKKFKFNDGRSKSVTEVKKNETVLTEGTDFYVDYQRSIITLDYSVNLEKDDLMRVSFWGRVNSANELIEVGAEIFKDWMNNFFDVTNAELNHDWIYETKYTNTQELAPLIRDERDLEEVLRILEPSSKAFVQQDGQGRLGISPRQTVVPSDVIYLKNAHISKFSRVESSDDYYWKVRVYFNEDPQTNEWDYKEATDNKIWWKFNIKRILPIYIYSNSASDAQTLANDILAMVNKDKVKFDAPAILFGDLAGNLTKFNRKRFPSLSGAADNVTLRILSINKSPSTNLASIVAEVAQ
ncbi:MAG: fibronectin type III domain-containing protein [Candidatus Aenigmatarchaeota archaeon]|nr:MAG: fibronectin type III domain-containing protein [Candidatus Aenigmarchaeota archaeon]